MSIHVKLVSVTSRTYSDEDRLSSNEPSCKGDFSLAYERNLLLELTRVAPQRYLLPVCPCPVSASDFSHLRPDRRRSRGCRPPTARTGPACCTGATTRPSSSARSPAEAPRYADRDALLLIRGDILGDVSQLSGRAVADSDGCALVS